MPRYHVSFDGVTNRQKIGRWVEARRAELTRNTVRLDTRIKPPLLSAEVQALLTGEEQAQVLCIDGEHAGQALWLRAVPDVIPGGGC